MAAVGASCGTDGEQLTAAAAPAQGKPRPVGPLLALHDKHLKTGPWVKILSKEEELERFVGLGSLRGPNMIDQNIVSSAVLIHQRPETTLRGRKMRRQVTHAADWIKNLAEKMAALMHS
ncbi:uncharacterized protein AKAME5_001968800 [Lates japonicus]|uniref:Uncharacterized protein n=1 Tax=Lates japonicus TaxID=270547 RepID=A0AAD3NBD7_LATJO|nr:uncharacterized protein AKAME5_001968800 [Lates japonicus]